VSAIIRTLKTVLGLFVDDGSLAIGILALLVWVGLFARVAPHAAVIILLVGGTVILLLENVMRAARA
jgi:hypothetical protein